jgi:hypothetical protein
MIFQEPKQYSLEKSGKMENSQLCLTKTSRNHNEERKQKKKTDFKKEICVSLNSRGNKKTEDRYLHIPNQNVKLKY